MQLGDYVKGKSTSVYANIEGRIVAIDYHLDLVHVKVAPAYTVKIPISDIELAATASMKIGDLVKGKFGTAAYGISGKVISISGAGSAIFVETDTGSHTMVGSLDLELDTSASPPPLTFNRTDDWTWVKFPLTPGVLPTHADHEVVKNSAYNKEFYYCRNCKIEVEQPV